MIAELAPLALPYVGLLVAPLFGYMAAIAAVGVGLQAYGVASMPSGKLSTAQRREMEIQTGRADEQFALQKMLQPFLLEQMGLEADYSPSGSIRGLKKRAPTTAEARAEKIKAAAEEKVLAGLEGRLDLDPAATRALNEDEARQEEYLARSLGPDFRLASGGATALSKGREGRRITESAIRRGEMTAAEAIAKGRIANEERNRAVTLGILRGMPQDLATINAASASLYPSELSNLEYQRQASLAGGYAGLGGGILKGAALLYGMQQGRATKPGAPGATSEPLYDRSAFEEHRAGERAAFTRPEDTYWER